MTRPVQVTFRNMDVSPALEQEARSRAAWLDTFHPGIIGCRVMLEIAHQHRRRGRPLHVRVELSLPGEDVIVDHEPTRDARQVARYVARATNVTATTRAFMWRFTGRSMLPAVASRT